MEKPHNVQRISRRNLLGGLGSAAALTVMGDLYRDHTKEQTKPKEVVVDKPVIEHTPEAIELSDSRYWNRYVDSFKDDLARDSNIVIERLDVIKDIQENINLSKIGSDIVRDNLERLIPALAFVESRLDPTEISEKKASGILQLMPKA